MVSEQEFVQKRNLFKGNDGSRSRPLPPEPAALSTFLPPFLVCASIIHPITPHSSLSTLSLQRLVFSSLARMNFGLDLIVHPSNLTLSLPNIHRLFPLHLRADDFRNAGAAEDYALDYGEDFVAIHPNKNQITIGD